jgi:2-polyprenyl-3-methyl-5-hydroxy-6-metoxy-1,4-benzoquinol methylase
LYDQRYAGDMKFRTSPLGLHSAIVSALGGQLDGRTVLDIGCGAGRLALFAGRRGAQVTALDFSPKAIELAQVVAGALDEPVPNVEFAVGRFEELDRQFDVVLMTEVFEHIETPPPVTLQKLSRLLVPGGVAVVSSPGFVNFRGIAWMTLQKLFGFLMSPSDVHFIQPWDVPGWCKAAGLRVDRQVGMFHDWGWGRWAAEDMTRRIRLALADQRKADARWDGISVDLDAMNEYLARQGEYFERILDGAGAVLRTSDVPERLQLRADVGATAFGREAQVYLSDAAVRYTDAAPWNSLGATNIFMCRKA